MNLLPNQLMEYARNALEMQVAVYRSMAGHMVEGMESLAGLTFATARSGLPASAAAGNQLFAHLGVDGVLPWQSAHVGEHIERLVECQNTMSSIVGRARAEINHEVERHAAHASRLLEDWIASAGRDMQAGPSTLVSLACDAVENAARSAAQLRHAALSTAAYLEEQATGMVVQGTQTLGNMEEE